MSNALFSVNHSFYFVCNEDLHSIQTEYLDGFIFNLNINLHSKPLELSSTMRWKNRVNMLHIKHQVLSSSAHLVHDASNSIYLPPTQLGSDYIKYATVSLHGLQVRYLSFGGVTIRMCWGNIWDMDWQGFYLSWKFYTIHL